MSRQWTPEQRHCIDARGGTVLVSAAAGSGKTTVLVERVIRRITDEQHPVDADRLLVVTFTKAAAAEMKQRLGKALAEQMAAHPHDRRLQRQQMLLPRAHISTVHSFCSALLRENFHLLDISPQFKVAEDADVRTMQQEALAEVMEAAYEARDPAFLALAELLSGGRDDRKLTEAVLRLYTFIQSHPFPNDWLQAQEALYATNAPIANTAWGQTVRRYVSGTLHHGVAMLRKAWSMATSEEQMAAAYAGPLLADCQQLEILADNFDTEDNWDDAIDMLEQFTFNRLGSLRQYPDELFKKRVTGLRDEVKKQLAALPALFCGSEAECREDIAVLRQPVTALCALVRQFSDTYEQKKAAKHWVDFNDLEHLTLRLLLDRQENGTVRRTPLAQELAQQFEEVLVDEYQDTNAAQDALFRAISRDEQNLFMVGDVKQSIYGFRQAMPDIFLARQKAYADYDGENFPATITLGHNFRSRDTVTDSVNFVFSQLMSEQLGGLTYDEHHALIPAASYPESPAFDTAFYVIDDARREDLDSKDAAEARLIAARIREWMGTMTITDHGETRPARYGDFCILLRSKSTHAAVYADELGRCGIPAWTASSGGFFATPEIGTALSLLRLVDNPMRDVPLLAVMMSPVGGFLPDDLASIRTGRTKAPLYVALREYARRQDDPLAVRCDAFLQQMEGYRCLAASVPADQLIHRLFTETGLEGCFSVRPHGEQRVANLRLLHEYARRFEQGRFRGLSAFVRYLDRLEEQQMDLAPASTLSEHADVVRIISIHHSKGLEFPVVFLAGLGHQFNTESTKGDLLMQASQGIGLMRRDPDTRKQFNTLPRQAVALSIRQAERAEELRVLYVAMTRAKEKLCLVMTARDPQAALTKHAATLDNEPTLPAHTLLSAGSMGDWLMMAALRHPSGGFFRKLAGEEALSPLPAATTWQMEIVPSPAPAQAEESSSSVPADPALVEEIDRRIGYQYPFAALTEVPSKLAASALSHRALAVDHIAEQRPAFWEKQPLSAAERGTAMHAFMEHADFGRARTDLRQEADRLLNAGVLNADQRAALRLPLLGRFFDSELCARMLRSPRWLREQHFTVDMPLSFFGYDTPPDSTDERIVVQGIADSVFEEDGQLVIVDYKTDRVQTDDELVQRYREQLRIYKQALEQTLSCPVGECWLYSFALGRAVRCDV